MARQIESKTIFSGVDKVSPIVDKITKNLKPLGNELSKVGKSLQGFGSNTLFKSGAGLTGMFYGLLKPAMQVEKAMANVKKVFGEEKFGSFAGFQKDLTKLSNDLNISLVDIANLTSNLPIMATKNKQELLDIIELTRHSMETMDMDAVRASSSVKTFFNSVGRDYKQAKIALGAINELGNLEGVTNADLIDFGAMGALGTGISAGMKAKEVMALGSAYLSLGQTSDRAKTSAEHAINAMTISSGASKPQRDAFKVIGMTPEQTAEDFASKEIGKGHLNTLVKVFKKINELPLSLREGTFANIFGKEGLGGTKLLAQNLDMLSKRFQIVQNDIKLQNSLSEEYNKKTQTSTFFIEKIFNRLKNLKDLMIISLLPTFKKVADYIDSWADKYDSLSDETKKMIGDAVLLTAGLLTFGVAVGGVSYALGGLAIAMGVVTKASKLMGGADMIGMLGGGALSKSKGNWQKLQDKKNATGWSFKGRSKFNKANLTEKIFGKGMRDISQASLSVSKLVGVVGIAITVFEVLTARVTAVAVPFLPLIGLLALIGGSVYSMIERWDEFKVKFENIGHAFKFFAGSIGIDTEKIGSKFEWLGDIVKNTLGTALLWILDRISESIYGLSMLANYVRYGFSEGGRRNDNLLAWQELAENGKINGLNPDYTGDKSPNQVRISKQQQDWLNKNIKGIQYAQKFREDKMNIVVEILGDKNAKVTTDLNGTNMSTAMKTGGTLTPTLNYTPIPKRGF